MQQAISLAKGAANFDDVPVGALIVNEQGEVLATGQNLREKDDDPTAHAEMVAILEAMVKTYVKNPGKKLSPKWKMAIESVLNTYLGQNPTEFTFEGKSIRQRVLWKQ